MLKKYSVEKPNETRKRILEFCSLKCEYSLVCFSLPLSNCCVKCDEIKEFINSGITDKGKKSYRIMKISRRAMKCQICYSDELGKVSDIKDSDERFEMLNDFFLKIQNIVYREAKREFLRNWRKFKLPYPYK